MNHHGSNMISIPGGHKTEIKMDDYFFDEACSEL